MNISCVPRQDSSTPCMTTPVLHDVRLIASVQFTFDLHAKPMTSSSIRPSIRPHVLCFIVTWAVPSPWTNSAREHSG